jgi:MYXO-CTERM domain-containing protein
MPGAWRWLAAVAVLLKCSSPTQEDAPAQANAASQAPTDDWQQRVQRRISDSEYRIRRGADGWEAGNRAQGLRARWGDDGVSVQPRTEDGPTVQLTLTSWGRQSLEPVAPADFEEGGPRTDGAVDVDGTPLLRLMASHGPVTEWWENRAEGLEQGFTIARAPAGDGPLRLVLSVTGARATGEAADAVTLEGAGGQRLRYAGMKAWDAAKRPLRAWLEARGAQVQLVVDDAQASYPLQVDPLLTAAAWTAESNQASAVFGSSVASAGDVNGDGFGDVIVGAVRFDNGETDEGRAFVYLGSASGLSTAAVWTAESNQANAYFGSSVASAGDVNGDGFGDVIIGAYAFDNGETDEGRAFVYLGSASGLAMAAAWTAESNQAAAWLGSSVASAGDINGDGYGDVIVGATNFDNGETDEGRAFVYLGSASGLSTTAAWTAESNQAFSYFGRSASAGDVNGDGYGDVIVGAWLFDNGQTDEGRAFVYLGSASGLSTAAAWTAEPNQADARLGSSVASAGDVNGDGYGDVIVGATNFDNGETNEGRAFVYLGSASGLSMGPAWTAESNQALAGFGISVASAGDVNGDGYSDVIVGASTFGNGEMNEGRAFVYLGAASGLSTTAAWTAESNQAVAFFGSSVASAGDVNGDGYGDVIVGASFFDNGETEEGRAFVHLGAASGLSTAAAWTAESNQAGALFGCSVASAGDVNGDGYGDVIVGAPGFSNGETDEGRSFVYLGSASGLATAAAWTAESNQASAYFGRSVASAGDVNGDGYGDVIVGARLFDNGETDEGRAFVYLGSASGLSTAAAWTAESNQANAAFGNYVASAGDVNGDGYGDVIVGAWFFANGETDEGRAFVYVGSASGLSTTAVWTAESNQAGAQFGYSVASAGDVNGDGFGDVIVGAYRFDDGETDEGRAFVYLGSASGLSAAAAWTAESDQTGANFGVSVASAGDVNGDGYGDVIVGAWFFDNGQTDEGRAFVYLGSTSGLSMAAAWTAESNQATAYFGSSVSFAGDVNGDGYGDVVVGAIYFGNGQTNEGRAFVYLGSASGLSTAAAWTAESNQAGANFGVCVASAGDVNGDGYGDVIIGAINFDNGEPDEGRAFVYLGNGQDGTQGVALVPQARQRGVVTPVAPGGLLRASPTAFDVGLLTARLPVGRARVRLEGELKPLGVPFNGLGLIRSPGWVDTGTTGALAQLTFSSLAPGTGYHWRARLLADPSQGASTATSRWLVGGLSGQPNAVHVRTPGVDAGVVPDAGADAGLDAGLDAGTSADAGLDAGADVDAGADGGGAVDGGQQQLSLRVGCGCSPDASAPGVWWMVAIGLLTLARRRRSSRMALASVHVLKALASSS